MHRIKPFFNGSKTEEASEYQKCTRFIRESCKIFSEFYKLEKDFLSKSIDGEISKALKELTNDMTNAGRPSSILKNTIQDLLTIHEHIDAKRREWSEKLRLLCEQAKEKQTIIRQTLSEYRENYERNQRKFETADANLKKFQNRSDRTSIPNYDDRLRELENTRDDCNLARSTAQDIYLAETYRIASEEHSITKNFFAQYLFDQQKFYENIDELFSNEIPEIERRLNSNPLAPAFHCDLEEHCSRIQRPIAYPIQTSIRLLENSLQEEGIFRQGSNPNKQKKFIGELNLQICDKTMKLQDFSYDAHVPANTLKQYLRELPECLLTEILLPEWIKVASINTEEGRIERIGQLIDRLPKVNRDNLCYIIRFLSRITDYSSENKMTSYNLAVCIANSMIYPKDQASNSFINAAFIIQLMIDHHKRFFPPDSSPSKNPFGSTENLLDSEPSLPAPKSSGKHRAPPPPPRPSVQQAEISTEQESTTTDEKTHRPSFTILDRIQNRTRSMTSSSSKKENELSSDCNNNPTIDSGQIKDTHNENSPGEITQF